jgi:hypothetical protein
VNSLEEYRSLIDQLVDRSESAKARWVLDGQFPATDDNESINEVLSGLTPKQKTVMASLINDAKSSGIHDTLALFSELQNLSNLKISINESELPIEPFGTELNFDYVARKSGDEWPEL